MILADASFSHNYILGWEHSIKALPSQNESAEVAFKKCPFFEGGFFKL